MKILIFETSSINFDFDSSFSFADKPGIVINLGSRGIVHPIIEMFVANEVEISLIGVLRTTSLSRINAMDDEAVPKINWFLHM